MPMPQLTREEAWTDVERFLDGVPMTSFSKSRREAIKGGRFKWPRETQKAVKLQLSANRTRDRRRWTFWQVKEMREMKKRGATLEMVRAKFGGSLDAVAKLCRHETYKEVQ